MTGTQIRDALTEVSHAVDIPAPDRLAFERLVRAERVHRRTRRGLGFGAAAASVALVCGLALTGLPGTGGGGDGDGETDNRRVATTATDPLRTPEPDMYTPALWKGELVWVGDNITISTDQPAARVVGSTTSNYGALVADDQQRIWWVRDTRIASEPARSQRADGDPCLLYTSPSPRDGLLSRMPSSA